jgi:hypothetical protein
MSQMKTLHVLVFCWASLLGLVSMEAKDSISPEVSPVVGHVYGKAVTAADIDLTQPIAMDAKFDAQDREQWELMGRIQKVFGKPVIDRFIQEKKIVVTAEELANHQLQLVLQRTKDLGRLKKQLQQLDVELGAPDLTQASSARLHEQKAKLERFLTRLRPAARGVEAPSNFASMLLLANKTERVLQETYGGPLVPRKFGPEARAARRLLYEAAEQQGALQFEDAGVRHLFYYYFADRSPRALQAGSTPAQPTGGGPSSFAQPQTPKAPQQQWVVLPSERESLDFAPRQIVPGKSGLWFGGGGPGSQAAPLGYLDFQSGEVTLLLKNGSAQWNAIGTEAVAIQLEPKSLLRLSALEQTISLLKSPPECRYFRQVVPYRQRFCMSSAYQPLQVFDPWLDRWQSLALRQVTDQDSQRIGGDYYRPNLQRFVVGAHGDIWGFQGTHDASRGNAVCHYVAKAKAWQHYQFPWEPNRGDDHWLAGETAETVWFAGQRSDVLLLDKASHRWRTLEVEWPRDCFAFTDKTVLAAFPSERNLVKRLNADFSAWETVATLPSEQPITALATSGETLYLATSAGIYALEQNDAQQVADPLFYPWKLTKETRFFEAVFSSSTQNVALGLAGKLCEAVTEGDVNRVKKLLSEGADTEATTSSVGSTPFLLACANGHQEVAELLIEQGADMHAVNHRKQNALVLAARGRHRELADFLIALGVQR